MELVISAVGCHVSMSFLLFLVNREVLEVQQGIRALNLSTLQ